MKAMRRRTWALLIFVLAMLLYLPSVGNRFAYDDHTVIQLDERIHDLSSAALRVFTQTYWQDPALGLYRPLTSLSFAVDWALSGGNPHWFHFMNTVWNALAVTLVFLFLTTLVPIMAAVPGALLFAAHPVHVEAVANVVGRAEVLAGLFSIAALLVWCRAAPDRPMRIGSIAAVVVLYLLAVLSKESAIMLPALIALCDVARGTLTPGTAGQWLRRHARPLTMLAVAAVLYVLVRATVIGALGPSTVDPALDVATTTPARILTALQAWPFILRLLVAPVVLLSDYGPAIIMPALGITPAAAAGALILGGLVGGGLLAWSRGQGRAAAVLLFVPVAMLPASNLLMPIGVIVAERTLYLPSLALAMAVAFGFDALAGRRAQVRLFTVLLGVVIVLFAARTLVRIPEWRSTSAIFEALRRDRPDSFRGQWHHALQAVNDSTPLIALERYGLMLRTWPYRRDAVFQAAAYAAHVGDLPFAHTVTTFAVERWPRDVDFLRMHAGVQLDLGNVEAARETVTRALQIAPDDATLRSMQQAIEEGSGQ